MGQPRLDDLRIFAAVVEAGSLTAAGARLDLPKQTVSRRVAALEADLGVRLLHRSPRAIRVTPEGEAYGARCREVVSMADDATAAVRAEAGAPRGHLRITAAEGLGSLIVTPVLAELMATHPGVTAEVLLTNRRVDLVAEGFDVGLRVGAPGSADLVARRLASAAIAYVASPGYLAAHGMPETPDDLDAHDLIVQSAGGRRGSWPFVGSRGRSRWVSVTGRLAASHFDVVREAVHAGLGVAIFPAGIATADAAAGLVQPILSGHVPDIGPAWLVLPSRRLLAPAVRAFVDLAVARATEAR